MKTCGIICELNPFHNGHAYLISEAKRITGADYVVCVMSGDYVQRGIPAICDKYIRTEMALRCGADLVIELPVIYATSSSDYFAFGAVSLLNNLGCIDYLCFGSETGDINKLNRYVEGHFMFNQEAHIIGSSNASSYFREGKSYAKKFAENMGDGLSSNDMLAACYIRALKLLESDMHPVAIKRRGSAYLDVSEDSDSATGIRRMILGHKDYSNYVPYEVKRILDSNEFEHFPIDINDFTQILYSRIYSLIMLEKREEADLTDYMDVSENIAGRIRANIKDYTDYITFINDIHSKEYTKSRIMRALIHIMLDVRKSDYEDKLENNNASYARILGFRRDKSDILSKIKECSFIPIISKASDSKRYLEDEALKIFNIDIDSANLYEQVSAFKWKNHPIHDFSKEIVIV